MHMPSISSDNTCPTSLSLVSARCSRVVAVHLHLDRPGNATPRLCFWLPKHPTRDQNHRCRIVDTHQAVQVVQAVEVVYCICSRRDAHARGRAPCPQHSDDDSPDCLCSFLLLAITPPDSDAEAPGNRYSVTYSGAKRGPDAAAPAIVVTPQCPAPAQAPHSWTDR